MGSSRQAALEAAAQAAQAQGVTPLILGDALEGEAREVAKVMAAMALQARRHGQPAQPPCVLLSGGETTVTLKGTGRGGRNAEFLLALGVALDGAEGIHAIACDGFFSALGDLVVTGPTRTNVNDFRAVFILPIP